MASVALVALTTQVPAPVLVTTPVVELILQVVPLTLAYEYAPVPDPPLAVQVTSVPHGVSLGQLIVTVAWFCLLSVTVVSAVVAV